MGVAAGRIVPFLPPIVLTRPIGAVLGGVLGAPIGVRETLCIVTIAAVAGVLWLVGSPALRLKELPDAPE
jgi:hypothetical protein